MQWNNSHITSIGIDGNNNLIDIKTLGDLSEIATAEKQIIPFGHGSNVIVWDNCLFIRFVPRITEFDAKKDIVEVPSGTSLRDLVKYLILKNRNNPIQYLAGIPGTVWGAIFQNSGAYNHSISEFLTKVVRWDCDLHEKVTLDIKECNFRYRESIFTDSPHKYVILHSYFNISKDSWPDLHSIIYDEIIERRQNKFPNPYVEPNSGALFMPAFVSSDDCRLRILPQNRIITIDVGRRCKVPAGVLIEETGLKGKHITHSLYLSSKHANFLCRDGDSSLEEWYEAVSIIASKVKTQFGIELTPEVNVLGENIPEYVKKLCRTKQPIRL